MSNLKRKNLLWRCDKCKCFVLSKDFDFHKVLFFFRGEFTSFLFLAYNLFRRHLKLRRTYALQFNFLGAELLSLGPSRRAGRTSARNKSFGIVGAVSLLSSTESPRKLHQK